MRLMVISDTHGDDWAVERFAALARKADAVAHLGDVLYDARHLQALLGFAVLMVRGNNDVLAEEPDELVQDFGGVRALLTHGHRYAVKSSLHRLSLAAQARQATLAFFGHTHEPLVTADGPLVLVNPGARYTYADVRIEGGAAVPVIRRL